VSLVSPLPTSFSSTLFDIRYALSVHRRHAVIPTFRCHCVPRPQSASRCRESERSAPSGLCFQFPQKPVRLISFFHPHSAPFIGPQLRGNSCALQLRLFCFSVSSQKLFANGSQDFLCPSRNADPRFGSRPLSLSSAPTTGAEMETQEMYVYVKWNRISRWFARQRLSY
jgi:hypothetical protein